jgi:hypothetical protein
MSSECKERSNEEEDTMSFHTYFTGDRKGATGRWKIEVGWDDRLKTYYAKIWAVTEEPADAEDETRRGADDECFLWLGTKAGEIDMVELLLPVLRLFGECPDYLLIEI